MTQVYSGKHGAFLSNHKNHRIMQNNEDFMTDENITKKNKMKRQIFSGEFQSYDIKGNTKRIYIKDIRNTEGELIKDFFWFNEEQVGTLLDNLEEGNLVSFSAEIVYNLTYNNGIKLTCPEDIKVYPAKGAEGDV